jgi:hypothetical protein
MSVKSNTNEEQMSDLYKASRNGDLTTVGQLLPSLSLEEINQIEPNGSTCLHAACLYNYPNIVRLLLENGASRTLLNKYKMTPFDEAATEEIKQLFPRSAAAGHERFFADTPQEEIEWISTEHANYGTVNRLYMNTDRDLAEVLASLRNDPKFQGISNRNLIEKYFEQAQRTQDYLLMAKAYSAETGFYGMFNKAIASGSSNIGINPSVETRGLSNFLMFISLFIKPSRWKKYHYFGTSFRGMKLSRKDFEKNYKVGQSFLLKPFTSTSKSRYIADFYAPPPSVLDSGTPSVLCIYTIPEKDLQYTGNIALDISTLSEFPNEEEVLILPHTSFQIQAINPLPSGIIEIHAIRT